MWPFDRKETDAPEQRNYTAAVTELTSGASTTGQESPIAMVLAAGYVLRAFASATVSGASATLFDEERAANMAYELLTNGETIWHVRNGVLNHVQSYSVLSNGSYQVSGAQALGADLTQATVRPGDILHARYVKNYRDLRGRSLTALAPNVVDTVVKLEKSFSAEMNAPTGYVLPIPTDGDDDTVTQLKEDLAALQGRILLMKTSTGGWDAGRTNAPRKEYELQRIGADIPDGNVALYKTLNEFLFAMLGIPNDLVNAQNAAGQREAWRRFLHSTVQPMAKIISAAAARINLTVTFDFEGLFASDITGRARAFNSLVQGGMDVEQAATVTGILTEEE